jgi:hypothetical protein
MVVAMAKTGENGHVVVQVMLKIELVILVEQLRRANNYLRPGMIVTLKNKHDHTL